MKTMYTLPPPIPNLFDDGSECDEPHCSYRVACDAQPYSPDALCLARVPVDPNPEPSTCPT